MSAVTGFKKVFVCSDRKKHIQKDDFTFYNTTNMAKMRIFAHAASAAMVI